MENKRHFTRVVFSTPAKLKGDSEAWDTSLIDLCFQGALIAKPDDWSSEYEHKKYQLTFKLAGSDIDISMYTKLAHIEDEHLGLACELMDIDSATHLRKLIALNSGDEDMLHRELAHLAHPE
ncbi:PilZ domain-containing protein [Flocculibacter collagenilyticus]|uniref:PilZ domain-containing protein n=1 Tax=Flocculibacter collagenilyticus TaxID=2744479 RepID=UPI0018F3B02B|nr:PilZ domain-containing protein [Flocculibacter collagenilyticus]